MSKAKKMTAIVFFLLLTVGEWISWPFLKNYVDENNYENREKAVLPVLSSENMSRYPFLVEEWYDDRIPFRNQMISMNSAIDYYLFNTSSSKDVIKGKDGWLFYGSKTDGDPIGCYQGKNLWTEEQLQDLAEKLVQSRDNLAKEGIDFVIFVAPNRERIYADEMPWYYGAPADYYLAKQICEYLKNHTDLKVLYPYEELKSATDAFSGEYETYHKTDTHWNELGAYCAMQPLFQLLKIDMPLIDDVRLSIVGEKDTSGDLANMLNLKNYIEPGMTYHVEGYDTHDYQNDKWIFSDRFIYHATNADPRRLLVRRDSFCSAMSDELGSQFNYSCMVHSGLFDNKVIKEEKPDLFIYETVERYIGGLADFYYE